MKLLKDNIVTRKELQPNIQFDVNILTNNQVNNDMLLACKRNITVQFTNDTDEFSLTKDDIVLEVTSNALNCND